MATLSFAFGTILLGGMTIASAQDRFESRMTVLVYDYAGVKAETLEKAKQETSRILRHSGINIAWRPCRVSGSLVPFECPQPGPRMPALRLVSRFQLVGNLVHAEAMGYSTGDFATVSVEFAERLEESGVAGLAEILGHIIAHEIGHVLLPGGRHSVSGIMKAHWSSTEWRLMQQGKLNFAPEQSRILRAEVLRR